MSGVFCSHSQYTVIGYVSCCFSVINLFSCTISNLTGWELYGTMFLSAGKIPFKNRLKNGSTSRMETAKFLKILNTTRTKASVMHRWIITVPTTSNFQFVELRSRGLLRTRKELFQLDSNVSSQSTSSPAPVSRIPFTERVQQNTNGYLLVALVEQCFLIGIHKSENFCLQLMRPSSFVLCFLIIKRDLVFKFFLLDGNRSLSLFFNGF